MKRDSIRIRMLDLLERTQQIPKDLQYVGEVISIGRQLEFWNNKAHKIAVELAWSQLSLDQQQKYVQDALLHDAK